MKKFIALFLVFVLAMATTAFAAPASTNANTGPGVAQVVLEDVTVRIGGNGNSARLIAYVDGVQVFVSANRPANNAVTTLSFDGFVVAVTVRGNSIIGVNVLERPAAPPVRTSETSEFRQFVRTEPVPSIPLGTSEVAGSRSLVGLSVTATVEEVNFSHRIENATGSGVVAGFVAIGTLEYEYVYNYLAQYIRIYEWVDVTEWSDGAREEVVREGSEHQYGGVHDGDAYYTGPYPGSRAINVSGGEVFLTRGSSNNGQGQGFPRRDVATYGGFTVQLYLANQSPRVNVESVNFYIDAL